MASGTNTETFHGAKRMAHKPHADPKTEQHKLSLADRTALPRLPDAGLLLHRMHNVSVHSIQRLRSLDEQKSADSANK